MGTIVVCFDGGGRVSKDALLKELPSQENHQPSGMLAL